MVTSGVRRGRCQDDQLIVQGNCTVGHKTKHTDNKGLENTITTTERQSVSPPSVAPSQARTPLTLRLWQEESIWYMDHLEFIRGGRKHWLHSSERKEDSESLNKSLLLSQIDMWLILRLSPSFGHSSLFVYCLLFFPSLHWSILISLRSSSNQYSTNIQHTRAHTQDLTAFSHEHTEIRNNHLQTDFVLLLFFQGEHNR